MVEDHQHLSTDDRHAIRLGYFEGRSLGAIAHDLRRPVSTFLGQWRAVARATSMPHWRKIWLAEDVT